ncbi:MAG: queuosine precursor transporter [bacterium]
MKELKVAVGDTWQPKALVYLAMPMMALMLVTEVLNLKFVNFFGISIVGSQISYVLSLIVADILAEVYGYRRVRRLLWVGLGGLIVYTIFIELAVFLPPAAGYANNSAFVTLFSQVPRITTAGIIAYFVTELTNSYVMSRLKVHFTARYFYGRALTSVAVAQIVNVLFFYGIAFAGILPLALMASAATVSWMAVILCEMVVLPLTKRLARYIKEYEGIEHFDAVPRGLPSS